MKTKIVLIVLGFLAMGCVAQESGEVFMTTDQAVGNITFTPNGNLVYSHHPFFAPENRVMLYDVKTNEHKPFPNKKWNTP